MLAIPTVKDSCDAVVFCVRLATVLASLCLDATKDLNRVKRIAIPREDLLTQTDDTRLHKLLEAADQVVSDLRNVNVIKVSDHSTASVRWKALTQTQMRAELAKERDLLIERRKHHKTFGQLMYVGLSQEHDLMRYITLGAALKDQAGGLLLLVVGMMTWVDKQLQEEGVQISEASRSPAVNGKSDTLDAEGKKVVRACQDAQASHKFTGNVVSRKKHSTVVRYSGGLRDLAKRDMVLTELKYAIAFAELTPKQLGLIFRDANAEMAAFYQWTMANVTYQRAIRIFSDGKSGKLPYPPRDPDLLSHRRSPDNPEQKSPLEQLDMKCAHHDAAMVEALHFVADDKGRIDVLIAQARQRALCADSV
ncbi:MAG: hypothetical protein FRX49_13488 [Trebouxia sp. A1-2]|nr:MAG: hypothetical protein FRX49_13488 [Trebouxia sp. A1-2]